MIDFGTIAVIVVVIIGFVAIALSLNEARSGSYKRYVKLRQESEELARRVENHENDLTDFASPKEPLKSVREFLYMDIARLYSIYSQVFGGLSDKIIVERIGQLIKSESATPALSQNSADSAASTSYRRTESGVLYDHMYNSLEQRLVSELVDARNVSADDVRKAFLRSPLVKVTGLAEIEDSERMSQFYEKWNDLGRAIAYAQIQGNAESKQALQKITSDLGGNISEPQRQQLLRRYWEIMNSWAANNNLLQDEQNLTNLRLWIDVMNRSSYNVLITPQERSGIRYRGILNKAFLRTTTDLLRWSYSGLSSFTWTMVGIVTLVPAQAANSNSEEINSNLANQPTIAPGLLDTSRAIFRSQRAMEDMFFKTTSGVEVVVSPIAIYREFNVSTGATN